MYPLKLAESRKILAERAIVKSSKKSAQLTQICKKHGEKCTNIDTQKRKDLLKIIDVIPSSLAMAQSANESAWVASRFAKKAIISLANVVIQKAAALFPRTVKKGPNTKYNNFRAHSNQLERIFSI